MWGFGHLTRKSRGRQETLNKAASTEWLYRSTCTIPALLSSSFIWERFQIFCQKTLRFTLNTNSGIYRWPKTIQCVYACTKVCIMVQGLCFFLSLFFLTFFFPYLMWCNELNLICLFQCSQITVICSIWSGVIWKCKKGKKWGASGCHRLHPIMRD